MALVLCFNELSCEADAGEVEINKTMTQFVAMLQAVRRRRPQSSLVTPVQLPGIELAQGYPMSRWAADGRHRDSWRLIRSLQNRAPFTFTELPGNNDRGVEYVHEGRPAVGLGLAHSLDTLAVGLPAESRWLRERVTVVRLTLTETSAPVVREDMLTVRHASTADHADAHDQWLASAGMEQITTGRQLWAERFDYFPRLSFLPRVEGDLAGLDSRWLRPVCQCLAELQRAVSGWDPGQDPFPNWLHVTPEHERRRRLCRFRDLDGSEGTFDLHARFAPEPGRVYLRLVREDAMARIAYIGRKLGV